MQEVLEKVSEIKRFVIRDIKSNTSPWQFQSQTESYCSNLIQIKKVDGQWSFRFKSEKSVNFHKMSSFGINFISFVFLLYFYIKPNIKRSKNLDKMKIVVEEYNRFINEKLAEEKSQEEKSTRTKRPIKRTK